jgi:predicted DCC family thiol-disulfide oxidoreductase YuxK
VTEGAHPTAATHPTEAAHPVVFFDGVCNMCNAVVDFVMKRDPKRRFRFVSLQSAKAAELIPGHDPDGELASLMLLENGVLVTQSTAALKIARHLSGPSPLLYGFIVAPRRLRDIIYRLIARNRYKWFGKRDTCRLPSEAERALFL